MKIEISNAFPILERAGRFEAKVAGWEVQGTNDGKRFDVNIPISGLKVQEDQLVQWVKIRLGVL